MQNQQGEDEGHKIYLFNIENQEGEIIETEIYAKDFFIAWDVIIEINGDMGIIEVVGMEETCLPEEWDYVTNEIKLSN